MKLQNYSFAFSILFLAPFLCIGQNYEAFNHSTYGGIGGEIPQEIIPDGDDFMLVGQVGVDANLGGEYYGGYHDVLVARLDQNGEILWSENYGGSDIDAGNCIAKAPGGFIIGGRTYSSDGQISDDAPDFDRNGWLIKVSDTGTLLWEKSFGLDFEDEIRDVVVLEDGSIVTCGLSEGFQNGFNGKIIKTDASGNLLWEHSYGGSESDIFTSLVQTDDGGFLITGSAESSDFDVEENNGSEDFWIVKTDSEGNLEWEDSYGGSDVDRALSIKKSPSGSYVVVGYTSSDDGDVSGHNGDRDVWVLWLDEEGLLIQEAAYGNEDFNDGFSIIRSEDNEGWIITGRTENEMSPNSGFDAWIFEVYDSGDMGWSVIAGGSGIDVARELVPTNSGYIVAGHTTSEDGDLEPITNFGADDLWVFNLELVFSTSEEGELTLKVFPNPAVDQVYFDGMKPVSEISLFGINGALLKTAENQNRIDVSDLAPGVYYLQIKTENLIVKRKIVVQ